MRKISIDTFMNMKIKKIECLVKFLIYRKTAN
jgi:hypothetical protein